MDGDLNGEFLTAVGLKDVPEARAALADFGSTRSEPDWFRRLGTKLGVCLNQTADPVFIFTALMRLLAAHPSPTALIGRFEQDEPLLPNLLQLLGSGRHLAEALYEVPELVGNFQTQSQRAEGFDELVAKFDGELNPLVSVSGATRGAGLVLRRHYQRERLLIAYGEFVEHLDPVIAAQRLSTLADAIIESSVRFIRKQLVSKYGEPRLPDGKPGRFCVISVGPLGGRELGYEASLDLLFLRDLARPTDGATNLPADEFFDQLALGVLELLNGNAAKVPPLYDVQHSHRPRTDAGSLALTTTEAYRHYQVLGRTWERLLYVKSRWVAGDESMANEFFHLMKPWVVPSFARRSGHRRDSDAGQEADSS